MKTLRKECENFQKAVRQLKNDVFGRLKIKMLTECILKKIKS